MSVFCNSTSERWTASPWQMPRKLRNRLNLRRDSVRRDRALRGNRRADQLSAHHTADRMGVVSRFFIPREGVAEPDVRCSCARAARYDGPGKCVAQTGLDTANLSARASAAVSSMKNDIDTLNTAASAEAAAAAAAAASITPALTAAETALRMIGRNGSARRPSTEDELMALLKPCPDEALQIWPADKAVGNVKNTGPQLIKPLDEAVLL